MALTRKNPTTKEVSIDRYHTLLNFTFKPADVTAVYHDENNESSTFVNHNGHCTCVIDSQKQLFDFCNSFLKPIVIETEEGDVSGFEDYNENG